MAPLHRAGRKRGDPRNTRELKPGWGGLLPTPLIPQLFPPQVSLYQQKATSGARGPGASMETLPTQ